MTDQLARSQRFLLSSNSADAAGRAAADFIIDLVLVTTLGASAFQIGVLNALGSVAFVVAAIPVGHLVDRHGALRWLRVGLAGKLALLLVLTLLLATNQLTVPAVLLLVTVMGLGTLVVETAQISAVPGLNDPTKSTSGITRLVARLTAADQALSIIIPAFFGLLISQLGASTLMALAAGLGSAALLLAQPIRNHSSASGASIKSPRPQPQGNWRSGLTLLFADRRLLAVTALVTLCNAGLAVGAAVESILILRHLRLGPQWFGVITAFGAVGGLLGAAFSERIVQRVALPRLTVLTGFFQLLLAGLVFTSYFTVPYVSLALLLTQSLLWGVVLVIFNIASMSWVTTIVDPAFVGRVSSARRLFTFGAVPVGSLAGGAIGSTVGIWASLLSWCLLCAVGTLSFLLLRRGSLRTPPAEL